MSPTRWLEISSTALDPQPSLTFQLWIYLEGQTVLYRDRGLPLAPADLEPLRHADLRIADSDRLAYLQVQTRSFDRHSGNARDPQGGLTSHLFRMQEVLPLIFEGLPSPRAMECAQSAVASLLSHLECCAWSFEELIPGLPAQTTLSGHSTRVAALGLLLGKELGIADLPELGLGLMLHDIGLVDLVGSIDLAMEDPSLHPKYGEHPQHGVKLISRARGASLRTRDVIQNHHERLDGSGFPRGISGDPLSDAARIAGIVDRIERWRASGGHSPSAAHYSSLLETLRDEESDRFDPRIIELFLARLEISTLES